jgi:hypothetical protein
MGAIHAAHAGWPYTGQAEAPAPKKARRRLWWSDERRDRFAQMWRDNNSVGEIADFFEIDERAVYAKAGQWKLGRRRPRGGDGGAAIKKKRRVLARSDPSGQRRFVGKVHDEFSGPKVVLEPHHPASRLGSTVFAGQVEPASRMAQLLKSGEHSRKLGKTVTKGKWAGSPIFSLTLEERATCPRTCKEWATCYGNNLHHSTRIYDDGTLTRRLWGELAALNARHPGGFLVRLHVLGDFYSVDYVDFWRGALNDFPALRIFGFTARQPADPIGAAVLFLMRDFEERVALRISGGGQDSHCADVVDRKDQATGFICPAELKETICCANCTLCWTVRHNISFLRH